MFALLLLVSTAQAGWTQPAGASYLKLWDRSLIGNQVFMADGRREKLPAVYQDHQLNLYGEYGITDRWTLVGKATPAGWSDYAGSNTAYIGDHTLGVRRALATGDIKVSVQVEGGGAPGQGERVLGYGDVGGDPWVAKATLGTAHAGGNLSLGGTVGSVWLQGQAGGTWFSRDGLDPVVTGMLGGGHTWDFGLSLAIRVMLWLPLGPVDSVDVLGLGQTRYVGYGGDFSYRLTDTLAITWGVAGAEAWSNASTPSILLGLEWKRG